MKEKQVSGHTASSELQEAQSLGAFRKEYVPRVVPGRVMLGAAIFCGVMSVLEIGGFINKYLNIPGEIAATRYEADALMIAAILGIVFLVLAVVLGSLYFIHSRHRVRVYEGGVLVSTWREHRPVEWKQIVQLKKDPIYGRFSRDPSRKPINWTYTLLLNVGEPVTIRGLEELERLGRIIKHETHL